MAGFTYFIFKVDTDNKTSEKMYLDSQELFKDKNNEELCSKPTKDNPFMNVLMNEYVQNPTRKPACDISRRDVKKNAKKLFNNNLYRDVDDVFQKNASDRNFYTNPGTTVPNDQDAFLKFLYPLPKTCKEGNEISCYKNSYRPLPA
jgi:hypothetical protein